MRVSHSVFAHHVLVNTYSKAFIERYDREFYLSLQWGVNGLCVTTHFRTMPSLVRFVRSLPNGRAKRSFSLVYYVSCFF